MKKRFHLAAVLANVTGLLADRRHFTGLQQLYDAILAKDKDLSEGFFSATVAKRLLEQFPQLAGAENDIPAADLQVVKAGTNQPRIAWILESWLNRQIQLHGETLEVELPD